jgi:hypothetical protein
VDAVPRLATADAFAEAAGGFAEELSRTVQSVAGPECQRFRATVSTEKQLEAAIRQDVEEGIPLSRDGVPILSLEVRIWLIIHHRREYLRVQNSQFKVFPADRNLPVFRYEYELSKEGSNHPAAHVQFHGEHPDLAEVMKAAGRKRTRSSGIGAEPNITDLHFPVGGSRFRPCLEDVLEMLIREFSIDPLPDLDTAIAALQRGRMGWRNRQLRTAVRDDPTTAADTLTELGYLVTWPSQRGPEPPAREEYLRGL